MTSTALTFDSAVAADRPGPLGTSPAFEAVACCACGHRVADPFISAEDDLTGRPGRFTFRRCRACGLVYQTPRLTIERVKDYYDDDYLAHRQRSDWGWMSPLFHWAMGSIDREKLRICNRYLALDASSAVLDVGCGGGTFLAGLRERHGSTAVGVGFVDLADRPAIRGVEFHCGLFYDQDVGSRRFDLVTMWHFLEHDYPPLRSLIAARRALRDGGRLVIEVPRLDSLTFRLFKGPLARTAAGAVAGETLQSRHADRRLPEAIMTDRDAVSSSADRQHRARLVTVAFFSAVFITAVALALVPIACLTLFRTRRLYRRAATLTARAVLHFGACG